MAIDTLKIGFHDSFLQPHDKMSDYQSWLDGWTQLRVPSEKIPGLIETTYRKNQRGNYGAYCQWEPSRERVTLEFSAKTLLARYLTGIDKNTLPEALRRVEKTLAVKFTDIDTLCENARVFRADIAFNPRIHTEKKIKTLYSLRHVLKWPFKRQDRRYESSVRFGNTKEQVEFYDKTEEMERKDKFLFALLKNQTAGVIRYEYRTAKLDKLCERFGGQVLVKYVSEENSHKENIVYLADVLNRQKNKQIAMSIFDEMRTRDAGYYDASGWEWIKEHVGSGARISSVISIFGKIHLWEMAGGDENILLGTLREFLSRPTAYRIKDQIVNAVIQYDRKLVESNETVNEYREALQAAA